MFLFNCLCMCMQRVNQWRERRALHPRCWGMRCVACVGTRHLASTITCWAARAVRASSDVVWLKEHSMSARTQAAARWTCTCAASASSAGCASAGKQACWNNVSGFFTCLKLNLVNSSLDDATKTVLGTNVPFSFTDYTKQEHVYYLTTFAVQTKFKLNMIQKWLDNLKTNLIVLRRVTFLSAPLHILTQIHVLLSKSLYTFSGVLSEEQIRLKKMKKQHEEETARSSSVATPSPAPDMAPLAPEQQEMIEKLVAMQKQCNKRSFIDRLKVTVNNPFPLLWSMIFQLQLPQLILHAVFFKNISIGQVNFEFS